MRKIKITSLKVGDWVYDINHRTKRKFKIYRFAGYKFDKGEEIDEINAEIKDLGEVEVSGFSMENRLSKKELEAINIKKNRIKMLESLKDEED